MPSDPSSSTQVNLSFGTSKENRVRNELAYIYVSINHILLCVLRLLWNPVDGLPSLTSRCIHIDLTPKRRVASLDI